MVPCDAERDDALHNPGYENPGMAHLVCAHSLWTPKGSLLQNMSANPKLTKYKRSLL